MRSYVKPIILFMLAGWFFLQAGYSSPLQFINTFQQPIEPDQRPNWLTNSIGMHLMRISKGKFMMGSHETEKYRENDEAMHEVTISCDFYMGDTEVTRAQWQKINATNLNKWKGDQWPVEKISWEDAVEFCKILSEWPDEKKIGRKYRLPTEAEWEYACRAKTTTPFNFGSILNGKQAKCDGTRPYGTDTEGPYFGQRTSVRKYQSNAWGLHDMHGNVSEWCSDWYGDYPKGPVTDPRGPEVGSFRVHRGGCWIDCAANCRSAFRGRYVPSRGTYGSSINGPIGFRIVMTSSENPK